MAAIYEVLVVGGELIDGTGAPRRRADIGISAGRIVAVGDLRDSTAARTIDARGQLVTPGFIDLLGHSYYSLFVDRSATSKVLQGVTLEVTGERLGAGPVIGAARELVRTEGLIPLGLDLQWADQADYEAMVNTPGTALNIGCTVPGALLRASVVDPWLDVPLSSQQFDRVCDLLRQAFDLGAVSVTFVLEEAPCCYFRPSELERLLRIAKEHNRLAMFHLRDEGSGVLEALDEVLHLLRITGARGEILHLKALGAANWHLLPLAIQRIERARRDGVDVQANAYPYTAAGLALQQLVPGLVRHSPAKIANQLRVSETQPKALLDRLTVDIPQTLWRGTRLAVVPPGSVAQPFSDLANSRGITPAELALELLTEAEDWVHLSVECIADWGLETLYAQPWMGVVSDGGARDPDIPILTHGPVHPREYGTFPRFLQEFVYEREILTEVDAISRITSRAADRLAMPDRGRIVHGAVADILVYDPRNFDTKATLEQPNQLAEGMNFVLVNGQIVVDDGTLTDALPGGIVSQKCPFPAPRCRS